MTTGDLRPIPVTVRYEWHYVALAANEDDAEADAIEHLQNNPLENHPHAIVTRFPRRAATDAIYVEASRVTPPTMAVAISVAVDQLERYGDTEFLTKLRRMLVERLDTHFATERGEEWQAALRAACDNWGIPPV